jgi:large subunit ribosomal protein L23
MKDMIIRPRISEKAYQVSQVEGSKTYVFEVPKSANKLTVARAVEAQFEGVKVADVRTAMQKGKPKQSYRKGHRPITGQRNDVKKAYVTLSEGSLPFFADVAAEEEKAKVAAEKAEKKAKKEAK